jgi:hypothetical protein
LTLRDVPYSFSLSAAEGENTLKEELAPVELRVDVEPDEVSYSIWRTDIRQNMFYDR